MNINKRYLFSILDNERQILEVCVYISMYMLTREIAVQVGFLLPSIEYAVSTASMWAKNLPLQPPHTHNKSP